ncbi:hypothetical protein SAMN05421786_11014 [Chryseobacterium ureilyticum]|uniref:Uncharacterized protein n=1 Tax=Chryseobacterium ureilyticum TaxID=373668 RepID=A0A1N7QH93_9FLAO|nr:hypothetical protein SAMN05421786_11014 [Chryseobacterium ureilyticum]
MHIISFMGDFFVCIFIDVNNDKKNQIKNLTHEKIRKP